jgi:hypothetical protein
VCQAFVEQLTPTRSRTPGRDWAEIEARRRRRRRRWRISLKDVLSDIALPMLDVPVGVADVGVPDDRVHPKIAGLHRRISWAPVTWACRVVLGAAGPGLWRRTGMGLGGACTHHPRDAAPQQHGRCQPHDESLHKTGIVRSGSLVYPENSLISTSVGNPTGAARHRVGPFTRMS